MRKEKEVSAILIDENISLEEYVEQPVLMNGEKIGKIIKAEKENDKIKVTIALDAEHIAAIIKTTGSV